MSNVKRQTTIIRAHDYWKHSMNPWSRIPVITSRRSHYDWFLRNLATDADLKNKLYFYCNDATKLRGQKFAMAIVVEPLDEGSYAVAKAIEDGPRYGPGDANG